MRAVHFYIILFFIGIGFSCKKKTYPESTAENNIVYYFNATVNNKPVSLEAGNDGYYMYSSVQLDQNGVYNFLANLKKGGCTNCANNSIQIQINNFTASVTGIPIDSAFKIKNYPIAMNPAASYSVQFNSNYNMTAVAWNWDFGDGQKSQFNNPSNTYTQSGVYNVCLSITGADGCVNTICNLQKIGLDGNPCKTFITSSTTSGNGIQFTQNTSGGTGPYVYEWDFGDGQKSSLKNPPHIYEHTGGYPVTLKVIDANNNVATANYNTVTLGDVSSCASNYAVVNIMPVANQQVFYNLSEVIINWTDADGKLYTSNNMQQPASSYFNILSVKDSDLNENGEKTKKLHVKFKCTVYNGTSFVLIDNADAVISVAYK